MTSKDFIRAEAENTDRIILYREGLFWKAYERSAFAVCTQIRLYETTDESLRSIAWRMNLTYNSLDGYVRHNHSDPIGYRKKYGR